MAASVIFAGLHPQLRDHAQATLDSARAALRAARINQSLHVTSVLRTRAAQALLFDRYRACVAQGRFGRTPECQWPANPPGCSMHEYGLAWDTDSLPNRQLQDWWNAWRRAYGWRVLPNDEIHAEYPLPYRIC